METYCVLVKMTTIYINGKMCHHCSKNPDAEGESMIMYFFFVTCMVPEDNENPRCQSCIGIMSFLQCVKHQCWANWFGLCLPFLLLIHEILVKWLHLWGSVYVRSVVSNEADGANILDSELPVPHQQVTDPLNHRTTQSVDYRLIANQCIGSIILTKSVL